MAHTYQHPRAAVTVDAVVFGFDHQDEILRVLLVQRAEGPFTGRWALPGTYLHMDETLEQAIQRALRDKANLTLTRLEQLATFDALDRDPRDRNISVAYMALVRPQNYTNGVTAPLAAWFKVDEITEASLCPRLNSSPLAFDHFHILSVALERLRSKIRWQPVGFDLLPPTFTLGQLERLYEAVLGRGIEKRNFRRRVLKHGLIIETGEVQRSVGHRPGALYRFDKARYDEMRAKGFDFEV